MVEGDPASRRYTNRKYTKEELKKEFAVLLVVTIFAIGLLMLLLTYVPSTEDHKQKHTQSSQAENSASALPATNQAH